MKFFQDFNGKPLGAANMVKLKRGMKNVCFFRLYLNTSRIQTSAKCYCNRPDHILRSHIRSGLQSHNWSHDNSGMRYYSADALNDSRRVFLSENSCFIKVVIQIETAQVNADTDTDIPKMIF